jgi:hypothetical protein
MKASEIIANQAEKSGHDPQKVLLAVKNLVDQGNTILLREQDTIFIITRAGGDAVEVTMCSADGAMNLPKVVLSAMKKIKASGAKIIYGDEEDQNMLEVFQQIGVPFQPENSGGHAWSAQI